MLFDNNYIRLSKFLIWSYNLTFLSSECANFSAASAGDATCLESHAQEYSMAYAFALSGFANLQVSMQLTQLLQNLRVRWIWVQFLLFRQHLLRFWASETMEQKCELSWTTYRSSQKCVIID